MATVLIPAVEQIRELRKLFLEKLDIEGAPSTCVGKSKKSYEMSITSKGEVIRV